MLFKSLFGTGQQPWVLAVCLLETYSSSNCPAFFPWENVGNSPNYRLGSGTTLTRWLFCIRSHELWRLMDGFGLLSSTWERSWPSPMIVRYFLIRMKGISSSSSHTCSILVLGAARHLPSLELLLWSVTVPENLSFLYKITKYWKQILSLVFPLIYKAPQCCGGRIWGLKFLMIVHSTPLILRYLYSICKKSFVLIFSKAVCGQNLASIRLSYQVPLKSRVHQLRLRMTWAASISLRGCWWTIINMTFCYCLSLRTSLQFCAGLFSTSGTGNVNTCRKQHPCAQRRAEAHLDPSGCPWPFLSYLGWRVSVLSPSVEVGEAEKKRCWILLQYSRGITFAFS